MTGRYNGSGASWWPRVVRHWPCNWNTPPRDLRNSPFRKTSSEFVAYSQQAICNFTHLLKIDDKFHQLLFTQFSPPAPFLCWGQNVDLLPAGWDRPTNNFGSVSSSSDGTPSPPIYATTCCDPAVMTSLTLPQTHPPPPHGRCEEEEGFEGQLRGLFTPAAVSSSPYSRTMRHPHA